MITGDASINTAVEAIKKGAHDYLSKPIDLQRLEVVLTLCPSSYVKAALERGLSESERILRDGWVIAGDEGDARDDLKGRTHSSFGAHPWRSGTGKELVANSLVAYSDRARRPYIKMNSAALPKDTLESELFGHVKGGFHWCHQGSQRTFRVGQWGTLSRRDWRDAHGDPGQAPSCHSGR